MSQLTALRAGLFIVLCGWLVACSDNSSKSLSDNLVCTDEVSGIVNGHIAQRSDDLSSSTVLLLSENQDKEVSVCTGTLIDRDMVLTAAHCAATKMYVTFVRNIGCLSKMEHIPIRAVKRSIIRKTELPKGLGLASEDLLVVRFEGSTPEGFYPRSLPSKDLQISGTENLLMAGYGRTSENGDDTGVLRFTETSAKNLLSSIYLPHTRQNVTVDKTWMLDQRSTGVCLGDSGGPLYLQTSRGLILIGITSLGVDNTSANSNGEKTCQGVALFTDVRAHLDWIQQSMVALRRAAF